MLHVENGGSGACEEIKLYGNKGYFLFQTNRIGKRHLEEDRWEDLKVLQPR